jgi:hypothetical protein
MTTSKSKAVVTVSGQVRAKALTKRDAKYVQAFQADPSAVVPERKVIRASGDVVGHVVYLRSSERFQVDLTDQSTFDIATVYIPMVVGEKVSPADRTVAFRAAVREARWVSRTVRKGKRLLVRQLGAREALHIDARTEGEATLENWDREHAGRAR